MLTQSVTMYKVTTIKSNRNISIGSIVNKRWSSASNLRHKTMMKHNYLSHWTSNRIKATNSSLGYLTAPDLICNDQNMTPVWTHIFPPFLAQFDNLCWSTGRCRINRQDQQMNLKIHIVTEF